MPKTKTQFNVSIKSLTDGLVSNLIKDGLITSDNTDKTRELINTTLSAHQCVVKNKRGPSGYNIYIKENSQRVKDTLNKPIKRVEVFIRLRKSTLYSKVFGT